MLHLIYLRDGMIVSKVSYRDWREIQDAYEQYVTSLEAGDMDELIGFFEEEYGPDDQRWAFTREEIRAFALSDRTTLASNR